MKKLRFLFALIILLSAGMATVNFAYAPQSYEVVSAATVIKQGSRGTVVKTIQQRLKNWGYYTGSVDGIFGSGTKKAVIAFQKKNKLFTGFHV